MLKSLFQKNESIEYSFDDFTVYSTKYNGEDATKIRSKETIKPGETSEMLLKIKSFKHPNLAPIYRITNHSIFTKKLFPFFSCKNLTKEYKKYFISKIKETLEFLHEAGIYLNTLKSDDLFLDRSGNPVLANFFGATLIKDDITFVDHLALDKISISMVNKNLKNLQSPRFYNVLESGLKEFKNYTSDEKKSFIESLNGNRKFLIDFILENIYSLFLEELSSPNEKAFKIYVLEFLKDFDREIFLKKIDLFFKVVDSNVRFYLLTKLKYTESLDSSADDISLGIQVSGKMLKIETLTFIFRNKDLFSKKSMDMFIEVMAQSVTEEEAMSLVCKNLLNIEFSNFKYLYKLIFAFLKTDKAIKDVYDCLERYYSNFDKYKVCCEILPLLCSRLSNKDHQDQCFRLVENIVQYLKKNKGLLENKEWGLSKVKGIFRRTKSKIKDDKEMEEKIKQITENIDDDDEWAEQDI